MVLYIRSDISSLDEGDFQIDWHALIVERNYLRIEKCGTTLRTNMTAASNGPISNTETFAVDSVHFQLTLPLPTVYRWVEEE